MATRSDAAGSTATAGLKSAAGLGAIGLSLSGMYAMTGIGIPCPWRYLTHTLCPFCGATNLGAALLRGEVGAAWAANPFVLLLLGGLGIACVCWLIDVLGGPSVHLPRQLRDQRIWYAALGLIAVVFAVIRNLIPAA